MLFLVPVFYALNWGMTDQPIRGLHRALGSGALHASLTRWLVTRPPSCHCVSASCLSTSFVSDKWQVGVTGFAHPHLVLWYHLVTVSNRRSCDLKHDFGLLWTPLNSSFTHGQQFLGTLSHWSFRWHVIRGTITWPKHMTEGSDVITQVGVAIYLFTLLSMLLHKSINIKQALFANSRSSSRATREVLELIQVLEGY